MNEVVEQFDEHVEMACIDGCVIRPFERQNTIKALLCARPKWCLCRILSSFYGN